MPPPFWMHCNICALEYNPSKKFYLLSCQHTLCRDCMKSTDNGKKCPLDKKSIQFEEVTKLQEKQIRYFQPKILSVLNEPLKMIKFQRQQISHYMDLIKSYKKKYQKATQLRAKMEADYIKLNAEHKKMVARRQVMQAKLKQLYVKRNQRNTYRDPYDQNSTGSTNSNSFQYTPNCSSLSSNSSGPGHFFNTESPITSEIKKSQNSRSPFFV